MKPYSALAVANEFIELAGKNHDVTPMKLMKLVYFAHAWNWGFIGDRLIDEEFQAWKYGPVSPALYQATKEYGNDPVNELLYTTKAWNFQQIKETPIRIDSDDSDSKELIELMWSVYGNFSAVRLSQLTHQEGTPWKQVSDRYNGRIPLWETIPEESIKEYYSQRLQEITEKARA